VPSSKRKTCREVCASYDNPPCRTAQTSRHSYGSYNVVDTKLCPHKDKIVKNPLTYGVFFEGDKYIVSEKMDGSWVCSCPASIFQKMICSHILEAKRNPHKYEIDVNFTGRMIKTFEEVFK